MSKMSKKSDFPSIEADLAQRLVELTYALFSKVTNGTDIPDHFNFNPLQAEKYGCYQFTLNSRLDQSTFENIFGREQILCPNGIEIFAYHQEASSHPHYEAFGDRLLQFAWSSAHSFLQDNRETVEHKKFSMIQDNIQQGFQKAQLRLKELYHLGRTVPTNTARPSRDMDGDQHFKQLKIITQTFEHIVMTQLTFLKTNHLMTSEEDLEKVRDEFKEHQKKIKPDHLSQCDLFRMDFKPESSHQKIQLHLQQVTSPNSYKIYEGTWQLNESKQPIATITLENTYAGNSDFQRQLQNLRKTAIERTLLIADKENKLSLSNKHFFSASLAQHISDQIYTSAEQPIDTFKVIKKPLTKILEKDTKYQPIHLLKYDLYGLSDQIIRPTFVYIDHHFELQQWETDRLNQYLFDQHTTALLHKPGLIYFLLPMNLLSQAISVQKQVTANNQANLIQLFLLFKLAFPQNETSKIPIDIEPLHRERQALSQTALAYHQAKNGSNILKHKNYTAKENSFFTIIFPIFKKIGGYLTRSCRTATTLEDKLLKTIFKLYIGNSWIKSDKGLLPALIHLLVNLMSQTKIRLHVQACSHFSNTHDHMQLFFSLILTELSQCRIDRLPTLIAESTQDSPFNLSQTKLTLSHLGKLKKSDSTDIPSKPHWLWSSPRKKEKEKKEELSLEQKWHTRLIELSPKKRRVSLGVAVIPKGSYPFWIKYLQKHLNLPSDITKLFYQYCEDHKLSDREKETIIESIKTTLSKIITHQEEDKIAINWLFSILNRQHFLTHFPQEKIVNIHHIFRQCTEYFSRHAKIDTEIFPLIEKFEYFHDKTINLDHLFKLYTKAIFIKMNGKRKRNTFIDKLLTDILLIDFSTLQKLVDSIYVQATHINLSVIIDADYLEKWFEKYKQVQPLNPSPSPF